jgi:hypothetical protein
LVCWGAGQEIQDRPVGLHSAGLRAGHVPFAAEYYPSARRYGNADKNEKAPEYLKRAQQMT